VVCTWQTLSSHKRTLWYIHGKWKQGTSSRPLRLHFLYLLKLCILIPKDGSKSLNLQAHAAGALAKFDVVLTQIGFNQPQQDAII